MNCSETREFLQIHFTAGGIDLDESVREHLDACPRCKAFYENLSELGSTLAPLADMRLTDEETVEMNAAINRRMAFEPKENTPVGAARPRKQKIFSIARIMLAAAAVVFMIVISSSPTRIKETAAVDDYSGIEYISISDYDVALLLEDSGVELLPSYIDQASAAYLASQLQPGQVDDLIESLSEEDISWIEENFAVEI